MRQDDSIASNLRLRIIEIIAGKYSIGNFQEYMRKGILLTTSQHFLPHVLNTFTLKTSDKLAEQLFINLVLCGCKLHDFDQIDSKILKMAETIGPNSYQTTVLRDICNGVLQRPIADFYENAVIRDGDIACITLQDITDCCVYAFNAFNILKNTQKERFSLQKLYENFILYSDPRAWVKVEYHNIYVLYISYMLISWT